MMGETTVVAACHSAMNRIAPARRSGSSAVSVLIMAPNQDEDGASRRRAAFVMASALPATAPARSARCSEREAIGVQEIEVGVEGLRLLDELLLLRSQGR